MDEYGRVGHDPKTEIRIGNTDPSMIEGRRYGNMSASIEDTLLQRIVGRTVEAVRPLRVVLFGSAARGEMNENSDVDLLLVMPDGTHRRDTARKVYRALGGLGVSKDIIVVTEDDLRRFGDEPSLVIYPALREGKEIYSAG